MMGTMAACAPASPPPPPPAPVLQAAVSTGPLSRYELCARLMIDNPPDSHLTALEIDTAVGQAQQGTHALKFGRSGKPQKRFVRVNSEGDAVYWLSRRKRLAESTIHFSDVERIQRGQHTWAFARQAKSFPATSDRSLSIVVAGGRSLDLSFDTPLECELWIVALQALLLRQRMTAEDSDVRFLRRTFLAEDVTSAGSISYAQVKLILRRLNIYTSKAVLKRALEMLGLFPRADPANAVASQVLPASITSGIRLSLDDFLRLVDVLKDRPDVIQLFDAVCGRYAAADAVADGCMPINSFLYFLRDEQREAAVSVEDARRVCAHFCPAGGGEWLTRAAFTAYLTSPANNAFAPEAAALHQDMTRPLSHYWCESSHNTYLEGDQLASASSASSYISAVQRGCRCVELDCWDGPDGQPIIYHGHTLTTRVSFAAVCAVLLEYGFIASRYPLILSLEVHCGPAQQARMAEILESTFGDALLLPSRFSLSAAEHLHPHLSAQSHSPQSDCFDVLPSPAELLDCVIVKAKVKKHEKPRSAAASTTVADGTAAAVAGVCSSSLTSPPIAGCLPSTGSMTPGMPATETPIAALSGGSSWTSVRDLRPKALAPALERDAFLLTVKFPLLTAAAAAPIDAPPARCMSSVKETAATRLLLRCADLVTQYCTRQLLRVFPSVMRMDSSNFNPAPFWAAGVQMVALNYQTCDVPLRLARALFRLNGRCGYVLKPPYLCGYVLKAFNPAGGSRKTPPVACGISAPADTGTDAGVSASIEPAAAPPGATLSSDSETCAVVSKGAALRQAVCSGGTGPRRQARALSAHTQVTDATELPSLGCGGSPSSLLPIANDRPKSRSPVMRWARLSGDAVHSWLQLEGGGSSSPRILPTAQRTASSPFTRRSGSASIMRSPPTSPLLLGPPRCPDGIVVSAFPSPAAPPKPFSFSITVLGAQHLPKRGSLAAASLPGSAAAALGAAATSPYCSVIIFGDAADSVKHKSRVVADNGFNPVWQESFSFRLTHPEVAVLYIAVHDHVADAGIGTSVLQSLSAMSSAAATDVAAPRASSFLAYYAAPLVALRAGYRSCPLRSAQGKKFPFCSLLCRFVTADD